MAELESKLGWDWRLLLSKILLWVTLFYTRTSLQMSHWQGLVQLHRAVEYQPPRRFMSQALREVCGVRGAARVRASRHDTTRIVSFPNAGQCGAPSRHRLPIRC
eukprot:3387561-Amphidinium_carterae.1